MLLTSLATDVHAAGVFGVDDRLLPEALLTADEERRYSATQVIFCQSPDGHYIDGAANVAGDFTHGVTVGHLFFDKKLGHYRAADECRFRVYDRNGKLLDEVAFKRRVIFGGEQYCKCRDLSMFELARRPKFVDRPLQLHATKIHEGERLMLVTYHFDVRPEYSKRKTRGLVYSTLGSPDERVLNIFHTDADAVPMSSGGPLYDPEGEVVGLFQGGSTDGLKRTPFDPLSDYNVAIRFDPLFLADFEQFLKER